MVTKIDRATLDAALAKKKPVLKELDLMQVDVRKPPVDFSGATLERCVLSRMNLDGLKFVKATLKNCYLNETSLNGADFTGATFSGATAYQKMAGASFKGANLKGFLLSDSDLRNADFSGAKLDGTSFSGSDLTGANFKKAKIKGDVFGSARGMSKVLGLEDFWFATITPPGGRAALIPASAKWPDQVEGADAVKAGGISTSSVQLGKARGLLIEGDLQAGILPFSDGVLIVCGSLENAAGKTKKAAAQAMKTTKGWKKHAHAFVSDGKGISLIATVVAPVHHQREEPIDAPLEKGTYVVEMLAQKPMVFVRLTKS